MQSIKDFFSVIAEFWDDREQWQKLAIVAVIAFILGGIFL